MTQKLPDNQKKVQVQFRCAPDLLKRIGDQAKKEDRTRSKWIERALWRTMVLSEKEKVEHG